MTPIFADTFYFLAILNAKDGAHAKAVEFSAAHEGTLVTTAWVLTELADGLSRSAHRQAFRRVLDDLESDPDSLVVSPTEELFNKGAALYDARDDKHWSLTDCVSFVVMQEHQITEDHHFEQAGFVALLK